MARLTAVGLAAAALAAAAPIPPPTTAAGKSELLVATSAQLAPLLGKTAAALERSRPGLRVVLIPVGSDVAMAELYTGKADLAVIGREATDPEIKAYQWVYQHPPRAWTVMAGSAGTAGHSPALGLIVNAANRLPSMTLDRLRLAFRSDRQILWRDLGATGAMAARPVHPIMPDSEQGTGRFIRKALFDDATLFAWDRVSEVAEPLRRDGADDRFAARIAAMVAADPLALAITPAPPGAGTRSIALTGSSHTLDRRIVAYGDPRIKPAARAFLRLLLGEAGTSLIAEGPYRPLPEEERKRQRRDLD